MKMAFKKSVLYHSAYYWMVLAHKKLKHISHRNYTKYMQKLKDGVVGGQLARRREYFLQDIENAKVRALAIKDSFRQL
jgi:hypothetical protein